MTRATQRLAAAVLLLTLACANHVSRDRWRRMSDHDKQLYVSSMIGEERAKHAKGGTGRGYSEPPETYVERIDRAYAHGDERDPAVIFGGLADQR